MKAVKYSLNLDLDLSLRLPHSLWPCLGQGAFRRAGVGRVRRLAFLNILLGGWYHVRSVNARTW
jgi:hypothetical protein